ncbi:MAG: hypothetical protein MUC58_11910 [Rhizobiaceae bacterium]|jgi:hypothetical protein|nr:hypothetical protein [Rhizobiaceae bacterium]
MSLITTAMKKTGIVALAGASVLAVAGPAAADWYGTAIVAWASNGCEGVEAGHSSAFRMRRPFVAWNGNFTTFTFYSQWGAQSYKATGTVNNNWSTAEATGIGNEGFRWTGAKVKIVTMTPPRVDGSTRHVALKLDIEKWWGQNGCTVSLDASAIRTNQ